MAEQKEFTFKVTVKNLMKAQSKVLVYFSEQGGVVWNGFNFSGNGYEGRYAISGNDVIITITKKPLWAFNSMIVSKVREFLADV